MDSYIGKVVKIFDENNVTRDDLNILSQGLDILKNRFAEKLNQMSPSERGQQLQAITKEICENRRILPNPAKQLEIVAFNTITEIG